MSKCPSEKPLDYKGAISRLGRGRGDAALIKAWLEMAVEKADCTKAANAGRPGISTAAKARRRGAILPLLANLYLRRFLLGWKQQG